MECGDLEEEDDWIVVKKQKVTILVSPPSPSHQESTNPDNKTEPMLVKSSSGARRKRRHGSTEDDAIMESSRQSPAIYPPPVITGVISRSQEPSDPVSVPEKLDNPSSVKANGNKRPVNVSSPLSVGPLIDPPPVETGVVIRSQEPSDPVSVAEKLNSPSSAKANGNKGPLNASRHLSVGSQNLVNRRLRALNLERELKRLGGLSVWLTSQGLGRFVTVFEREKMGKYQLANLTTSKLKEMGTNAVGPRRKLIHAIQSLCHPYYYKALQ